MKHPHNAPRNSSGFVILSTLLIIGLIAAVCTTYMRHSIAKVDGSTVSLSARQARQSAESAFQLAQQSLMTGHGVNLDNTQATFTVSSGQKRPGEVEMRLLSDGRASLRVSSLSDNGLGSTKLLEVFGVPVPDLTQAEMLPTLKQSVSDALMSDPSIPKLYYNGNKSESDVDLYGLVIVRPGTNLTLDNVVIHGAIISDDALNLNHWNYNPMSRAEIQISGNFRIEPADFLPGVAIIVPDGALTAFGEGHSQIEGDIVAHTLELDKGSATGSIATISPFVADAEFQHVGGGRLPCEWADALDLGETTETEFVATVPLISTLSDLQAIQSFSFASRFGVK